MRSIDLGVEERVRTYAELDTFAQAGQPVRAGQGGVRARRLPAALPCAGAFGSLEEQLASSAAASKSRCCAAVPKGSGLGTSSILAATVLAALGDLCGLNWDRNTLFTRTLALEQMLTTGGGWQDQAGAIFRGIKLIETAPGLAQKPAIGWLPHHLFDHDYANRSILLYYTGITRLAKNILAEIVRGIFLNSPSHLRHHCRHRRQRRCAERRHPAVRLRDAAGGHRQQLAAEPAPGCRHQPAGGAANPRRGSGLISPRPSCSAPAAAATCCCSARTRLRPGGSSKC